MIEVFKTNVKHRDQADMLIDLIQKIFIDHKANFDLDDCDKILRVKCVNGIIQSSLLINLLKSWGFDAEVLPDDIPSIDQRLFNSIHTYTESDIIHD